MARIESHPPGQFCWAELGTTDARAGTEFYSKLLNWTTREIPMGPGNSYYIFQYDGNDAAAACKLQPEHLQQGVPPHWLLYVAVADAAATAAQARDLGATVIAGPFDVGEEGVMAVLRDPQGAHFAVWQAKKHIGARVGDLNFRHCWSELATTDAAAARDFYTALFGWTVHQQPMGGSDYTTWICSAGPTGGMRVGIPPHWMVYFSVPDTDAVASTAAALGGQIKVPPFDLPNVGRICVCSDPQGAVFSLIQLKM